MNNGNTVLIDQQLSIDSVPSLPNYVMLINKAIKDPDVSIKQVAELISQDIGLTIRILNIANSVLYRQTYKETVSINDAVKRIGFDEIRSICLSIALSKFFQFDHETYRKNLVNLWMHSLAVAFTSEVIIGFCSPGVRDNLEEDLIYSAGLLHDVGLVVICQQKPALYEELSSTYNRDRGFLPDIERVILGYSHAEVGQFLLRYWDFPDKISEIVRYHHEHEKAGDEIKPYAKILHIADSICTQYGYSDDVEAIVEPFDVSAWHDLGLKDENIQDIIKVVEDKIKKAELFVAISS